MTKAKKRSRGFLYYAHLYRMILVQCFKSRLAYRSDFIISMVGILAVNVSGFLSFWIMFQNFPTINGWTFNEMLFLYGFTLLSISADQLFFDNNWNLRFTLYSGDFIIYNLRPINTFFYFISSLFDTKGIGQLLFGTATLIYAWVQLGIPFSFFILIKFLVVLAASSLFMVAIINAAAASGFWIMNSGALLVFISRFKEYAKYPATIFTGVFKAFFTFIVPITFVAFYPSQFFLRPDAIPVYSYLTLPLGILFFYLSYKLWMVGARHYAGTGS